ncbi:MAG TPA: LysM peptidoglycan-binding domain-containing protein, partial [Candidatus Binatia bacterium]|nr:LysM peptidoglycan-binding domain-containing protein [Candidatus Binatia bacterium]
SQAEFFAWNPALNPTEKKLPPGYRLKVPPEKADRIAAIQRQPVESTTVRQSSMARESAPVHHRVSEGETLSKIAKVYRVSIAAIQKANGLGKDHSISVGQRLKIPKR